MLTTVQQLQRETEIENKELRVVALSVEETEIENKELRVIALSVEDLQKQVALLSDIKSQRDKALKTSTCSRCLCVSLSVHVCVGVRLCVNARDILVKVSTYTRKRTNIRV